MPLAQYRSEPRGPSTLRTPSVVVRRGVLAPDIVVASVLAIQNSVVRRPGLAGMAKLARTWSRYLDSSPLYTSNRKAVLIERPLGAQRSGRTFRTSKSRVPKRGGRWAGKSATPFATGLSGQSPSDDRHSAVGTNTPDAQVPPASTVPQNTASPVTRPGTLNVPKEPLSPGTRSTGRESIMFSKPLIGVNVDYREATDQRPAFSLL